MSKNQKVTKAKEEKKESLIGQIFFYLFVVIALAILAFNIYLRMYCVCVIVDGSSMEQTLDDKDVVYMHKDQEVKRGDIVVIDVSANPRFSCDYIIKRVVATEGDSIYCKNMTVYICYAGTEDYVVLQEDYVSDTNGNAPFGPYTIGEGEIFALGDHRSVSLDSRRAGPLPLSDVQGVVTDWSIQLRGVFTPWHNFTQSIFGGLSALTPGKE